MSVSEYITTLLQTIWTAVRNTVSTIGIPDVFDILIVAFLIYKLLQLLRRGRLGMVAKSIVFLVAALWISGRFNLMVLNFAASQALGMGILALVILFQPEIRQMLERLGRGSLREMLTGRQAGEPEMEAVILQTVLAATQMAEEKTGALIVFERRDSLEDEIKTGTHIDAQLSSELLKNIFYDNAPLHDGAVVVSKGRIVSAGCMLPLSDNANLSRDLGMRHRAGVGVSEKSDAVAVIVSEENGSISVAVDGMLKRHLAQDTFERLLRNELIEESAERKGVWISNLFKGKKHEESR
ncbi:MAG: diadenylate cyclase CdaA [Oscillospiraceae bacterium]|nr:diadenylate cyclase CdaA [Oscillospiraceae bacterium]